MTAKKKKRILVFAVAAVILLMLIIWTVWGNTALELNTYTITSERLPDAFDGYRVAHVSDLHNAEMAIITKIFLPCWRIANLTLLPLPEI